MDIVPPPLPSWTYHLLHFRVYVAYYMMENIISTLHICNELLTSAVLSIPPSRPPEEHLPLLPFALLARIPLEPR